MQIKKDKFAELTQLDRIEYRQIRDEINKKFRGSVLLIFGSIFFMVEFMILLLGFIVYISFPEVGIRVLDLTLLFLKVGAIGALLSLVIDILILYKYKQEIDKLHDRFFKVEVKSWNKK